MLINVIDVGQPNTHAAKNGRSYQSLEVTYKDDSGKVSSKKLMSFSNPSVFNIAKGWNKGDSVNVITQKDDQGYWQWTGISLGNEGAQQVAQQPNKAAQPTRVTGSNYETKEERAARQVMIVRQSSISSAVAALGVGGKTPISVDQVIEYAKKLEAYVLCTGNDKPADPLDLSDIEDDIPL